MKAMYTPDRRSHTTAGCSIAIPPPGQRRYHHPDFDKKGLQGWRAVHREATLPQTAWRAEQERAIRLGLPGAESIEDRGISTFARGELPHYAGSNTFLKAPFAANCSLDHTSAAADHRVPFASAIPLRHGRHLQSQGCFRTAVLNSPSK